MSVGVVALVELDDVVGVLVGVLVLVELVVDVDVDVDVEDVVGGVAAVEVVWGRQFLAASSAMVLAP